ncbi:hypothetical protein SAMN02745136_00244 [Anaerocolumna jejuensis DSM 15929]|uniref:Uncharacterized protein n=1 Tax=Anaerocolumna jejuensis DSM 15929 TaxID=1121322 RepID=A0A1M6JXK0_9FIRM|nr:hypothetical protein [Anaerocolumna jejuensis]SHJ51392.1 hypothetical protein SAMN02745136_00244 [Anaerocolumna jejuensis DSM 15929]
MLKVEHISVMNLENALRGARNPMNSWGKSDSYYNEKGEYILGENDLGLAARLCSSGTDHRKFMRQILVSMDITAPIYWWKEFDTYKVGTTANSTSTMHKIHSKSFEEADFSTDQSTEETKAFFQSVIGQLEKLRLLFIETGDKSYWYSIIQLLPSSYNQMRTCTLNYENLINMYNARKNHKLKEWHDFCDYIKELPYSQELITWEKRPQ